MAEVGFIVGSSEFVGSAEQLVFRPKHPVTVVRPKHLQGLSMIAEEPRLEMVKTAIKTASNNVTMATLLKVM